MTTIDEIMAQANRYALRNAQYCAAHITNADLVSGEVVALRAIITQAIAEARADGAREMREAAAKAAASVGLDQHTQWHGMPVCFALDVGSACTEAIRSLLLPAKREPVRLTDEQILLARKGAKPLLQQWGDTLAIARAIETAVLAANGLTK